MTQDEYLQHIRDFHEELRNDPVRLKEFMRKVLGPPKRKLEGEEYKHVWLILKMAEPTQTSNNQHSWCEEYYVGDRYYDVHYFPNEEPIIEEILKE